jgi:hypothetical protein
VALCSVEHNDFSFLLSSGEIIKFYWLFKFFVSKCKDPSVSVLLNPTRPGYIARFVVEGKPFNVRVICRL